MALISLKRWKIETKSREEEKTKAENNRKDSYENKRGTNAKFSLNKNSSKDFG
jgi:hypothetical protein